MSNVNTILTGRTQQLIHSLRLLQTGLAHRAHRRPPDGHARRESGADQAGGQSARDRPTQGQPGRVHAPKLAARHRRSANALQAGRRHVHVAQAWRAAVFPAAKGEQLLGRQQRSGDGCHQNSNAYATAPAE